MKDDFSFVGFSIGSFLEYYSFFRLVRLLVTAAAMTAMKAKDNAVANGNSETVGDGEADAVGEDEAGCEEEVGCEDEAGWEDEGKGDALDVEPTLTVPLTSL